MKRSRITLAALLVLAPLVPCTTRAATPPAAIVSERHVSGAPFLGFGVQWSPYPWCDPTDEDWERAFAHLDFMKTPLARVMTRSYKYCEGFDAGGKPVYRWDNNRMRKMYRLLDYCQSRNVTVILGEWDDPASDEDRQDPAADKLQKYEIEETDPRWAVIIGDLLVHLVKDKGYTCIKYFNLINEPNGGWSACADFGRWKTGILNVHREIANRGLANHVQLIGPDVTWQKDFWWLDLAVQQLNGQLAAYDVHEYAPIADVESGWLEHAFRAKRGYIDRVDPKGRGKPFIMGEVGMGSRGPVEPMGGEDSHPRIHDFIYGVWMADYNVQCMRAGMDGTIAWMLDDAMHIMKDKQSAWPDLKKVLWKKWGFFNSMAEEIGHPGDAKLRPWYYTWSLMTLAFPPGSKVLDVPSTAQPGVRVSAAEVPGPGGKHRSWIVVHDSDTPCTVTLTDPAADPALGVRRFNYLDNDRLTDAKGYPVPRTTLDAQAIRDGLRLDFPGRGVFLLTTLDIAKPAK